MAAVDMGSPLEFRSRAREKQVASQVEKFFPPHSPVRRSEHGLPSLPAWAQTMPLETLQVDDRANVYGRVHSVELRDGGHFFGGSDEKHCKVCT